MPAPAVKLDRSPWSVVAVCSCGWRVGADCQRAAAMLSASHLRRCHDDADRAYDITKRLRAS